MIAVVVGVAVAGSAWNPTGFASYSAMWSLVAPLVVGGAIVHLILSGWRPRLAPSLAIVAFVAAAAISTLASGSPWIGVLGAPGRDAGLLALVTVVGAALVGAWVGAHPDGRRLAALGIVAVGVVAAVVALLQLAGAVPPGLAELGGSGRATSFYGSATQLGAVTAFGLPLAIWSIWDRSGRRRWVIATAAVVDAAGLLASQSRAAWLGAIVGLASLAVFTRSSDRRERRVHRRVVAGAVGALVMVVAAIPVTRHRVASALDLGAGTGRGRVVGWSAAIRAVGEHWLLGVGPDQTRSALPAALGARYEVTYGGQEILDRAHDVVLDQLLWGGALGLVALIGLVVVVARLTHSQRRAPGVLAIVSAAAAYAVHLLVNFPIPQIDLLVWFGLGAACGGAAIRRTEGRHISFAERGWLVGITVAVFGIVSVLGFRHVVADSQLAAGATAEHDGDLAAALAHYHDAAITSPERLVYREVDARARLRAGDPSAAAAGARVEALAPGDPFSRELHLRTRALAAFAASDTGSGRSLVDEYQRLVGAVPSRVDFRVGLGLAQLAAGDVDASLATLTAAAEDLPGDDGIQLTLAMVEDQAGLHDRAAARRAAVGGES